MNDCRSKEEELSRHKFINITAYLEQCENCNSSSTIEGNCPTNFSKMCWFESKPGIITVPCPNYIRYQTNMSVTRECKNGIWGEVDVKACFDNYKMLPDLYTLRNITLVGCILTIISLTKAIIIFYYFRLHLKSTMARVHIHLFFSSLIKSACALILETSLTDDTYNTNPSWCVFLRIAYNYFVVSNGFWMFCEGVHLFLVLYKVFVGYSHFLCIFYVMGWGFPVILITISSSLRYYYNDYTEACWDKPSDYDYYYSIPVVVVLVLNFFILFYVLGLICRRLTPTTGMNFNSIKNTLRAAFLLTPLLGITFFVSMWRSENFAHKVVATILYHFTGFFIAILYCFANHEVLGALNSAFRRRSRYGMTAALVTFSRTR